ncbi:ABC transporter substrate-binding protein [Curvibacter sp. CHRR-16]|uniref:heme/hemin ABC transporter substrate-binding protein n=1 Tax=Curvibacter sp. CHRR-16 TaxID=2835872 RepID=UPI001BDA5F3E|nr:ABC transporter substrate-binding protein [Curvibacter sp. CHRR-16]MBT0568867.1 ABC transporter substrate-binding protein [Curvibacter sp. CHRR-16]
MQRLNLLALQRRRVLAWGGMGVLSLVGATGGFNVQAAGTPARRVVSIGGALTEIIYALGAESQLVGVDTTSLYPQAATMLPSVGYARALSAEGILALSPQLVVATEDAGPPAVLRQLSSAGLELVVLAANHRFEGLLDRVQRLGILLNQAPAAQQLTARLQKDWAQRPATPLRSGPAPRVLFVLSHSPAQIMVGGQGSSAQAMLEYVGARNAAQGFDGFKPLTPEAVIAAQPDVVLFTDQGLQAIGGVDGALRLPGIAQTPAGQRRRIVSQEAMFLLGFGPRLPAAVAALDAQLRKALAA